MLKTQKVYYLLNALSIYRGILNRSVLKGYLNLLNAFKEPPEKFLSAYGEFYHLLSERKVAHNLAGNITQAVLYDENIFTLNATADTVKDLPENVISATANDLNAILFACTLTADDILNEYTFKNQILEIIPTLPKWQTGKVVDEFRGNKLNLPNLASFHKENGCGMFARYKAFIWRNGEICPVEHPDKIDIDAFIGYESQRNTVVENTKAFLQGKSCNNCLLYGDMGTGKSSTVKAIANEFRKDGLRIVEMPKERLMDFPLLVDKLAYLPMKFIIFIDDLSFQSQDSSYTSLKAVLEGGVAAKPKNALIYATSNRRHIVKESWQDRDTDDVNRRDNMQETLSLSDRFGLSVYYGNPDKKQYLEIAFSLADKNNIKYDPQQFAVKAEAFALYKGNRSPRCAKQFVESLLC